MEKIWTNQTFIKFFSHMEQNDIFNIRTVIFESIKYTHIINRRLFGFYPTIIINLTKFCDSIINIIYA